MPCGSTSNPLGSTGDRRPGTMRHAATVVAVLLFVAVLLVLGSNRFFGLETANVAPSSTVAAAGTAGASTTTPPPATTAPPPTTATTTSTTTPPTPEIVSVAVSTGELLPHALVAVSAREAWAIMDSDASGRNLIGHFVGGDWVLYQLTESGWGALGLAVAPDGTAWAATDVGVFSFDGQDWTRQFSGPAGAVAISEDGAVWIGGRRDGLGGSIDPRLWLARLDGTSWERVGPELDAELEPVGGTRIVSVPDGGVWIAQRPGVWVEDDLMHYDGVTMEVVPIPGVPDPTPGNNMSTVRVFEIEADSNGDLWVIGYLNADPRQAVLARLAGGAWELYDWPFPQPMDLPLEVDLSAGPDGVMWFAFGDGLRSFDGTIWRGHLEGAALFNVDVAPDGTVWYSDHDGLHTLLIP